MPQFSKPFRFLIRAGYALAALAGVAYIVMSTPWFRRALERRVIAAVENATGGRVEVGEFRFRPIVLQIGMSGFVLHGSEPAGVPPLFTARMVVIGLSPSALLRRREAALRSLEWDGVAIHIRTAPNGATNIPGPQNSNRASPTLTDILKLSIGNLTLLHTDIFWNDQEMPLQATARNVAFQIRRHFLRGYTGNISSSQTTAEARQWQLPPTTLAAQFHFTRSDFVFDSIVWRSAGLSGTCSAKLHASPTLQVTVDYSAQGDFPALIQLLRYRNLGTGKVALNGEFSRQQGTWTAHGHVNGRQVDIAVPSFRTGRFDFSADYFADMLRVNLSNLKVAAWGGTIQGNGAVTLRGPSPAFALETHLQGISLAEVLRAFSTTRAISVRFPMVAAVEGQWNGDWVGRFQNFKSDYDLRFRPPAHGDGGALPLSGFADGTTNTAGGFEFHIDHSRLQSGHTFFSAQGSLGRAYSHLTTQLVTSDFGEVRPLADLLIQPAGPIPLVLKSPATFLTTLTGPVSAADIRGQVKLGAFSYGGFEWDSFNADLDATPGFASITGAHLQRGNSSISLSASAHLHAWQLDRNGPASLSAQAHNADIQGLESALGVSYPMQGGVTGQINLQGVPGRLSGGGQMQIGRGAILQQPFDSFSAGLHIASSTISLEEIQLAKGRGRLTGRAEIGLSQRQFSAQLHGNDFSPADVGWIIPNYNPGAGPGEIEGSISFDLSGHGWLDNPELTSTLSVRDFKLHGMEMGNLKGQVDWHGQNIQLQLEAQGAGGDVRLKGSAQTMGEWPVELSGDYVNFRADPWLRMLAGTKFNASVTASGSLTLQGPMRKPALMDIKSEIKSLSFSVADMAWSNGGPFEIHYAQRALSASPFQLRGPATNLQVEGSVRLAGSGQPPILSVSARGESEATLVSLLDPNLHASGNSDLSLKVTGTPLQPLLRGTLQVHNLSLSYGEFPFHLSDLNGEIQLQGDRATATALRGQVGGGYATIAGFLTFAEKPKFDIQAVLDQLRVQYPSDFTSLLTGELRLAGTTEGGQLDGDLIVRQMFASESFNLLTLIGQANSPSHLASGSANSPFASNIRLNVHVGTDPEVRLETRDLHLVADVDMDVKGTLANPVELGTIHVMSGEAVVRGNRYRLDRGDITMANPFRTQPILDLQARTRVQRYDLTMDISGPFDQVKVAYRSDPPLPSGDILSLLALGYVRQTEELGTTGSARTSTVGATALLSQALSSQKTGRIQRLFGVSRIKIDPNVGGPANVSGARITVEQQVTHDLTLTYATNTGATQQQVIQFEWALNENISLIGIRDQNGIFGVEIQMRRRFK